MRGHGHLCLAAIILSLLACSGRALSISQHHAALDASLDARVFVIVLGHGQEERSPALSATLHAFYDQLGPENFDCLVFVWNPNMTLPDVPAGCEVKVTPGVFMEFTALIPEDRLQASRYAYVMADDVTLNVSVEDGYAPMNIAALRDLAAENCLDAITASFVGDKSAINYAHTRPNKTNGAGRFVEFFDFQGVLLTPSIVHLLARIASADITGCWGYDALLYTAVEKWTGREPRLGIADQMSINVGTKNLSSHDKNHTKRGESGPCGKADPANRQMLYWHRQGLRDFHRWHDSTVGYLKGAETSHTKTKQACAPLLAPGDLALLAETSKFDAWLESIQHTADS